MSFQDLVIAISAKNHASAEFSRVVADAKIMASSVAANPIAVKFADIEVPDIPPIQVPPVRLPDIPPIKVPPIKIAVEVPDIPPITPTIPPITPTIEPIDTSPFMEVDAAINDVNSNIANLGVQSEASASLMATGFIACTTEVNNLSAISLNTAESIRSSFQIAGESIEYTITQIRVSRVTVKGFTRDLTTIGTGISAVSRLGESFGFLNKEQSEALNIMGSTISSITALISVINVFSTVTSVATGAQISLNVSYAGFLGLTGVGITTIFGAVAAMVAFQQGFDHATKSHKELSAAMADTEAAQVGKSEFEKKRELEKRHFGWLYPGWR